MRSKGISPIIASILLVLIVISLGSAFLVFSGRLTQETTSAAEEQVSEAGRLATSTFAITSVKDQRVFVRNTGSETIDVKGFDVRIDDVKVNYTQEEPIEPGRSGAIRVTDLWEFGPGERTLRVSGASFSASKRVRVKPNEGVVLDLRFEEGSGDTANDVSGSSNDGTLKNAEESSWVAGRFGKALQFDGSDDHASLSRQLSFADTAPFTTSVWYKGSDIAQNSFWGKVLLGRDNTDIYANLVLREGYAEYLHYNVGWLHNLRSQRLVADNQWHHIVYVNRPTETGEIYVDGVSEASGSSSIENDVFPYRIDGLMRGYNNVYTSGTIDEVRIYNRAYAPEELYVMELA